MRTVRLVALALTVGFVTPASAQINLVGYWNPIYDEDWLERIPGPDVGDYAGLPITPAARKRANTWEASLLTLPEHQFKPHPSTYGFSMWRIDNRNAWVEGSRGHKAQHPIAYYFYRNVHLTTSGNFRTQSLVDAILEIGSDRIMFSTDWPFENVEHAAKWFDAAAISENDRFKIGRVNAAKLLKLAVRS